MGLLDDLKSEAERARQSDADRRSAEARQQAFYEEHLRPALLAVYRYLQDLLEQLSCLNREVTAEFMIPGHRPVAATQIERKLTIDSLENLAHLTLGITFGIEELKFQVMPLDKARTTREFFETHKMPFSDWPIRDHSNVIVGLNFLLNQLKINGRIDLRADKPNGRLKMSTFNVRGFNSQTDFLPASRIDDAWLDKLGRFVIGQIEDPNRTEVTDAYRTALRAKIDREKRDEELEILRREEAERRRAIESNQKTRIERALRTVLGKLKTKIGPDTS